MPLTGQEFLEASRLAAQERVRQGRRSGPVYCGDTPRPLIWYDQVFAREAEPAGTIESANALRVGATQNGLDVVIVASNANTAPLVVDPGTMLTLVLLQADRPDGTFEEVGPSICVTAPAEGIRAEPDMLLARFALGSLKKPWARVKLVIDGTASGGSIDIALAYSPG